MLLTCGCRQEGVWQPHVALALRAAALDAMPRLWEAVSDFLAAKACAMHYAAGRVLALVPEVANARWETWYGHLIGTVGPVSGGVSAAYTGKAGLEHAQDEALSALALGERLRGPGHFTAYGDVFPLDYATRLVNNHHLRDVYEAVISKLASVGQTDKGTLLTTLDTFLATGCSTHAAATLLGVHRNTVLHRLRRITDITNLDFDDFEVRFLVQLALRAHQRVGLDTPATPASVEPQRNAARETMCGYQAESQASLVIM